MKYWAFISYSHADKKWGEWLHKALETYAVPKKLIGQPSPHGPLPSRLRPIFRDREELASSADLGATIRAALEQSAFLIVICSPRSANSKWVNEEVLAFQRMGKSDRILALIVEGEPAESFPSALREAEPIAADARPAGDGKRNAFLKLAAGLLGVGFDELKQRDALRRRRNLMITSAAAAIAIAVTAGLVYRSERALKNWKGSAPAYYAQAEGLLSKGNRAEALEKINAAIALNPMRADFHFLRGNILQSTDLKQALLAYEEALRLDPNDPRAKQNRDLCAKVISANPDATVLPDEAVFDLIAQIMGQGRLDESLQMIKNFAALKGVTESEMWRTRLEQAGIMGGAMDRFKMDSQGIISLNLSEAHVSDLNPLRGMPINWLGLAVTSVKDITPLAGMPLEELMLSQTPVSDISPLRGLPLRRLNLRDCTNIQDLTPLADSRELRELILPPNAGDIEFLRALPKLERISFKSSQKGAGWTPAQSAAEFWAEQDSGLAAGTVEVDYSRRDIRDLSGFSGRPIQRLNLYQTKVTDLTPLRGMPLVWLSLSYTRVADLDALKGMPLKWLSLSATSVIDITPLAGMPLEELMLSQTPASDISALRGLPLRRLNLRDCENIRDLSPLAECRELRELVLPPNAGDIEFLRALPKLERISFKSSQKGTGWTPAQSAEEFWAEQEGGLAAGTVEVDYSRRDISDLSGLSGRPIQKLNLLRTEVADLTPLRGMPLVWLSLSFTQVTDLEALKGMPLKWLSLGATSVSDITPLGGMPLEELMLSQTPVSDISPLRSLPLRRLNLRDCENIRDLSPLAECRELRELVLPPNAGDIEFLRALPNLTRISFKSTRSGTPAQSAEEFWAEQDGGLAVGAVEVDYSRRDINDLSGLSGRPIQRLNLSETKVSDLTPLLGMPLVRLNLSRTPVADIGVLKGMPLKWLSLVQTSVMDITPLAGMPLEVLTLSGTPVSDLAPLRGLPLRRLNLVRCNSVRDLKPLTECKNLRELVLPPNPEEIDFLRELPKLERISFKSTLQGIPAQTVEEFWTEYDEGKKAVISDQ